VTQDISWHHGVTTSSDRASVTGGAGMTVWLTGLSGSGKSTVAYAVEEVLVASGRAAYVLDGDNLRHGLNSDLGFAPEDRAENVRRVGHVAQLLADAGVVALVPVISPYEADRDYVRSIHEEGGFRFVEVFVDAPLEVCAARDPKGLYERQKAGEIDGLTGVDAPYEQPGTPDLRLETASASVEESALAVVRLIS